MRRVRATAASWELTPSFWSIALICERTVEIETRAAFRDFLRAMTLHEFGQDDLFTFGQYSETLETRLRRLFGGVGQPKSPR